ncbi:M16 family metallopeptidase [Alloalcanivorax marinus]|uniref:M16 family metallopeptidase n=1 Tax=Alloalcanivorax marinus TaxID=1177169 RepID=UPI001EE456C4|nr:pitrilysin family protein [Alloalcanivorax marinus]
MKMAAHSPLKMVVATLCTLALAGCAGFPTSARQVSQAEPAAPELAIQSWQTDQGAKVLFVPSEALPMLDVRLVMHAGGARDGDQPGLASLTSALIGEGAEGLSVDDIARGFEDRGASFSTGSYQDMGVISLRTLSKPAWRDDAVDLLARVIGQPTFPQDALDRLRTRALQGLKMEKQVPGPQVEKAFQRVVFGDHPYGHADSGTLESLPGITREDLRRFHERYYAAGNTVIALVGDVSRERAEAIAAELSAALPEGGPAPEMPRAEKPAARVTEHLTFPSNQTHILIGGQATWRGNPDHAALYVGNYILGGGGFASLLTQEVREKHGYVYGVSSYFQPMAGGGPFRLQLQTANDNADQALGLTMGILRDFIANGPTQEQLDNAKANILGRRALETADNGDIIGQLGAIGFYDLPLDYLQRFNRQVKAVTVADIREAFQRALDADRLAIVSIGPEAPRLPQGGKNETQGQDQ